ncbi:MAG: hypothetical protein Q9185_004263 [Variospora sp. 1 TL-2023]
MPTPTITIIGSLNTDLITRTPRLPHPGETLTATSFSTGCGGKGCNQAVACARLSRSSSSSSPSSGDAPSLITTRILGAVGDDEFGGTLIEGLQRNGVDASDVSVVKGQRTGVAVIVVEEDTGENRILLTPGANFSVTPSSVPEALFVEGKMEEKEEEEKKEKPALMILQLEIPLETVMHVCQRARANGVPVLLNPAPAPAEGKKGLPVDVFMGLEHLILNETEAGMLSGLDLPPPSLSSSPHDKARLADICHHFHRLGVMNVVLTLGARGVYWSSSGGGGGSSSSSKLDSGFIPATTVPKVVDTTAAGDTFVGAYAVAVVLSGEEEEEGGGGGVRRAVEWANRAAGKCVMKEGAMEAIPWRGEVGL